MYYDEIENMPVPEKAKLCSYSFKLAVLDATKTQLDWTQALTFPGQSADFIYLAKVEGQNYLVHYYQQFLPLRDDLLKSVHMTTKEAGFR